jgi:hypothetical protein
VRERIPLSELFSQPHDDRAHALNWDAGTPILRQKARLAELAPSNDLVPAVLNANHRRVRLPVPGVTINPTLRGSGAETEYAVHLGQSID